MTSLSPQRWNLSLIHISFATAVRAGCPVVPMMLCRRPARGLWAWRKKPCFTPVSYTHLGQASTSLLQRRCKLGYARAARIMDEMEQLHIIGPYEGSKPRQVLITRQQWIEMTDVYKRQVLPFRISATVIRSA